MKTFFCNTYITISVLFLFLSLGGVGGKLYAQEPELINNIWYLHSITISNQTTEAPRMPEMTIQAFFDNNTMLNEMCCAGELVLLLLYDVDQPEFEILNSTEESGNCTDNELSNFRDIYVDFFQNNLTGIFEYDIQENVANFGTYLILTITNPLGDTTEFYNYPHDSQVDYYIFGDNSPFQTHWYLKNLYVDGVSQPISNSIAQQTTISFSKDGSFYAQFCGEITSKVAFINDDGGGGVGSGEFYLLCNELSFTSTNCQDSSMTNIEQHFFSFLQSLAEGNMAIYERGHGDFGEFCGIIEFLYIYNPLTDAYIGLVDCLGPLALNSFNSKSILLYPNPVSEILYIESGTHEVTKMSLYDITGKLLKTLDISIQEIDVSNLNNGLYFLVLESATGETVVKKFLKR